MDNLNKKSLVELKELLVRQNNILQKRSFIAKLPDKGTKLYQVQEKLVQEISKREEQERRSVTEKPIDQLVSAMETLEWTGNYTLADRQTVDSDDESADETDVLKILSSQAGAGMYKKQYRQQKPETSLIRPEDIQVDDESETCQIEPYADRLCHRDETRITRPDRPYKPYKTVIPHSKTEDSKNRHCRSVHWENTAATFPDYVHGEVKPLSLAESLQLQTSHTIQLKEIQEANASDRLAAQIERLQLEARTDSPADETHLEDEAFREAEELASDEEYDGRGVVSFTMTE